MKRGKIIISGSFYTKKRRRKMTENTTQNK